MEDMMFCSTTTYVVENWANRGVCKKAISEVVENGRQSLVIILNAITYCIMDQIGM